MLGLDRLHGGQPAGEAVRQVNLEQAFDAVEVLVYVVVALEFFNEVLLTLEIEDEE